MGPRGGERGLWERKRRKGEDRGGKVEWGGCRAGKIERGEEKDERG